MFLGLLAYDWLRVIIWFDHMGLRVATLVNLSFLGGDRADEAAGRFLGHGARTRAIPDGIRRFGTWAPLLIPFYIPRGAEWDKAWTGAEALSHGGAMPGPVTVLGIVYSRRRRSASASWRSRFANISARRAPARGPRRPTRRSTLDEPPHGYSLSNGEVSMEIWRDGRGAASVTGDARGGFAIDLIRRPLDPLQPRGHFFYLVEEGDEPWSIGFQPTRRASEYLDPADRVSTRSRSSITSTRFARRCASGPTSEGAVLTYRVRLEDLSGKPRRLRLTSFSEIAGHETGAVCARSRFRRHACRDDLRPTAQRDPRAQPAASLGARRSRRNRVLRGQAGRGHGTRRLRGFAHPLPRRRFHARADWLRAGRWRKLDDQGKLWTFDPGASFTLSADITRQRRGRSRVRHGPRRQCGLGGRRSSRSGSACQPCRNCNCRRGSMKRARSNRPPALASRWPFSFSADGTTLHLTHRTPRPWAHVMANEIGASAVVSNDGDVYSAFRQLAPQRADRVPLRQRDDAASRPDRLSEKPRHGRDRLDRLRALPARRRDDGHRLRTRRRNFCENRAARSLPNTKSSSRPTSPATFGC